MALSFMANMYCTNVFSKSEIAGSLTDKEALNEFIAFRRDYMNMPIDVQIQDLKRVGIVKTNFYKLIFCKNSKYRFF